MTDDIFYKIIIIFNKQLFRSPCISLWAMPLKAMLVLLAMI